jgi:hypothetical protein
MEDHVKLVNQNDLAHIANLHSWAAQAAARGDMETAERFQIAAHLVFERAAPVLHPERPQE